MIFKVVNFNSEIFIPIIGCEIYHSFNKSKLNLSFFNNILNLNISVQTKIKIINIIHIMIIMLIVLKELFIIYCNFNDFFCKQKNNNYKYSSYQKNLA